MHKILINILRLTLLLLVLFGCREVNIYQYKSVTLNVLGGELLIQVTGTYGEDYTKDGKRFLDYGFPYYLNISFETPIVNKLSVLQIKNIEILGEESGNKFTLPNTECKKVKGPTKSNPDTTWCIAIVSGITSDEHVYENYQLTAKIIVIDKHDNAKEKLISILLETDFSKGRRSDKFDESMSI